MKKLYTTANLIDLEIIKSILEGENIHCLLKDSFPPGMNLQPVTTWPSLWVIEDKQFAKANEILEQKKGGD